MSDCIIRSATPADAEIIASFIRQLASFERLAHEAHPHIDALRAHLAEDANPRLHALIAEIEGTPVGFAVYFYCYSTFGTNWGLYLEDIYVVPEFRSQGIARELFRFFGALAIEKGCRRMDFNVLNWNVGAIAAYTKLGAVPIDGWKHMRFDYTALRRLANC